MDIRYEHEYVTLKFTMQQWVQTFENVVIQMDDDLNLTFPGFDASFIDPGVSTFTFPCSSTTFGTTARTGSLILSAHTRDIGYYIYHPLIYAESDYYLGKLMFGRMGAQEYFTINFPRLPVIECFFLLPNLDDYDVPASVFQARPEDQPFSFPGRLT